MSSLNLKYLEGKKIRITDYGDATYEGFVGDYISAEDNVPEEIEAIILDNLVRYDGFKFDNPVEFKATEIKAIHIL